MPCRIVNLDSRGWRKSVKAVSTQSAVRMKSIRSSALSFSPRKGVGSLAWQLFVGHPLGDSTTFSMWVRTSRSAQ